MYKLINLILVLSLIATSACMGGKKRSQKNLQYSGSAVTLDDSVGQSRADEIFGAIEGSLSASLENDEYKYGAKTSPVKVFTIDQLRVLVGSCGANSTKCDVEVFIDKGSDTMRPLFTVKLTPPSSCPDKFKAYVRSSIMLSKEALGVFAYVTSLPVGTLTSNWDTYCNSTLNPYPTDLLCNKKDDILSAQKLASATVNYGAISFDAVTSGSGITLTEAKFKENDSDNLICISDQACGASTGKQTR